MNSSTTEAWIQYFEDSIKWHDATIRPPNISPKFWFSLRADYVRQIADLKEQLANEVS